MSTSDSLMQFRTAYLQAIAESWEDRLYRAELLRQDDILSWPGFTRYMADNEISWRAKLQLVANAEGPFWEPVNTGGWKGPDDHFKLILPKAPEDDHQWKFALTAYYDLFPTLLGTLKGKSSSGEAVSTMGSGPLSQNVSLGIGGPESFLKFGAVTIRAIALAWRDKQFAESLKKDAMRTLSSYFGFNNPWNFMLEFIDCDHPEYPSDVVWNSDKRNWQGGDQFKNTVILNLPYDPAKDEDMIDIQALAITEYNDTGPAYPFTCS